MIISVENLTGYDDIVCEFALCTFNLLYRFVNFSWLFNVVYMCNERSHSICYTTTTYEVHAIKNQNKIKSLLRDIFVYHETFSRLGLFIRSCKFVIIETCVYDIAHDENAISSSIIQSI